MPERVVAALRFSDRWSDSMFRKKSAELLEELEKAGMKAFGQVFSMRYNAPFTPWFLRRNEVAVPVSMESAQVQAINTRGTGTGIEKEIE